MKQFEFQQLTPPGLREIKQVELWIKGRKCIPLEFQAEICPEPDVEIVQRIKNEKKEKLKLAVAKKRKLKKPQMDSGVAAMGSVMELRNKS